MELWEEDADNLHFRTTAEMLEEFAYLGADKAYEVVVKNSNEIAKQIEFIRPLEHKRISYNKEGDYERLEALCYEGLKRVYGAEATIENVDEEVKVRLKKEVESIKENKTGIGYPYLAVPVH